MWLLLPQALYEMQAGEKCKWEKGQAQTALTAALQMSCNALGLAWQGERLRKLTVRSVTRSPVLGAIKMTPPGSRVLMCDEHGITSNTSGVTLTHYIHIFTRVIERNGTAIVYTYDRDVSISCDAFRSPGDPVLIKELTARALPAQKGVVIDLAADRVALAKKARALVCSGAPASQVRSSALDVDVPMELILRDGAEGVWRQSRVC